MSSGPLPEPYPTPGQAGLIERMGIEILRADPERLVARMPVEGNTQPFGLLHGGASCVLVETLGSWGAALHGAPHGLVPLGVEINATHHRSTAGGTVTAVAEPLHLGRTLVTYQVKVTDDQDRPLCTGRVTCLLREDREGLRTQAVQELQAAQGDQGLQGDQARAGSVEDPGGPVP